MSAVTFILVSLLFSSLMLSTIFLFAWRTMGRKAHALTWSLAFVFGAMQWTCNLLRDRFPSHDTYWLLAGGLGMITVSLGLLGHRQRVGKRAGLGFLGGAGLAAFALLIWTTLFAGHVAWKMSVGPLYAALILTLCAVTVVQKSKTVTPAEWGTVGVNVMLALSQVAAVTPLLQAGSSPGTEAIQLYSAINFLIMPAAYIGIGMFAVFIIASDLSEEMKAVATSDQLTGVLNRRGLAEVTKRLFAQSRRTDRPLSVVLTDIDRFKTINDQFGHAAGDQVLLEFSRMLTQDRRAQDAVARVGGEEFVIVLPGMPADQAVLFADRLRTRVERTMVQVEQDAISLTASFGVATLDSGDKDFDALMGRADAALYRCKESGRNRVDLARKPHIEAVRFEPSSLAASA